MIPGFKRSFKRDEVLFTVAVCILVFMALSNIFWKNTIDPALAILIGGLLGLPIVSSSERKEQ